MKVYSLHVGDTKVPYGQFYGGLTGWTGMRGIRKFVTYKSHYTIVPIHAYLIDHPESGLILVDTGINWEHAHEHDRYYKGVMHYVLDADEYLLTREQELPAQMEQLLSFNYIINLLSKSFNENINTVPNHRMNSFRSFGLAAGKKVERDDAVE
jgi:hypothetical protein